jgi:redox-sensing transcriptional repressor
MKSRVLNKKQLKRMPDYLSTIKDMKGRGIKYVSSQEIADFLNLNNEQVKKDIAIVSTKSGIPNKGREINQLIMDIENVLGYDDIHNAIIIGIGNLGKALLKYEGFKEYGLKIVGAFDKDEETIGLLINGIRVRDINTLSKVFNDYNAKIGIITTPKGCAQEIADVLINSGAEAILNFSPIRIVSNRKNVIISNINTATNLSVLSHQLLLMKKKNEEKSKKEGVI